MARKKKVNDDDLRARIIDHLQVAKTLIPPSGQMLKHLVDMAVLEATEAEYLSDPIEP